MKNQDRFSTIFVTMFSFLIICSCQSSLRSPASLSKEPEFLPPPPLEFRLQHSKDSIEELSILDLKSSPPSYLWWQNYRIFTLVQNLNRSRSCGLLKALRATPDFPLQSLIERKSTQVCEDLDSEQPAFRHPDKLQLEIERAISLRNRRLYHDSSKILKDLLVAKKNLPLEIKLQIYGELRKNSKLINNQKALVLFARESADLAFTNLKTILNETATYSPSEYQQRKLIGAKLYAESLATLVRTYWTLHKNDLALRTLIENLHRIEPITSCDYLYYIGGKLLEEKGQYQEALDYYQKIINSSADLQDPKYQDKARWSIGWAAFKREDLKIAQLHFEKLINSSNDLSEKSRAKYWLAKTLSKAGNEIEAQRLFIDLSKDDPLAFYPLMAARAAQIPIENIWYSKAQKMRIDDSHTSMNPPFSTFFEGKLKNLGYELDWLSALGENQELETTLLQLNSRVQVQAPLQHEGLKVNYLGLFEKLSQMNLFLPLFSIANTLDNKTKRDLLFVTPNSIFPQPYHLQIQRATEDINIPSEFIYSIMRQESAFNPTARSNADALGLMQLIPQVAKMAARSHNLKTYKTPTDLFKPEISIYLGAIELKNLLNHYHQMWIPAIAAYNAGNKPIKRWLKERYREDPIEFIEDIPYDETRAYVKLVLRNLSYYWGLQRPEQREYLFPEKFLTMAPAIMANLDD